MAPFGNLVLWVALVVTVYSACVSIVGARRRQMRLIHSGIHAAYGAAALMALASAMIIYAFLSHDYSIRYVQHYSDATMPFAYKITAYWGGLDGSLMFWVFILTTFSAIAIHRNRERHRELIPYVVATCMAVTVFFIAMLIFVKNPFETFLGANHPVEGKGLNPLLQNYWMQVHPPSLYTGFVSATIPFAFGMGALLSGNLDDAWLRSVRVWAMISWFFLSMGLTLGSMWAYEVLGWGGYWGWDPVENAGFLPWLTSTAFLHSIMIQERRGMLKVWNVTLVIITFLLTIFGTTMTRSGIVQSVHAFGQDNVLLLWFMTFMGVVTLFSIGLIIYRLPLLRSRSSLESWVSREFAFVINNWVLLFAAFFILCATMFPTISEALTKERITVGPPFYNKWMVPIGLILLALTGIGPLLAWRRATIENLKNQFAIPLATLAVSAGVLYAAGVRTEWAALACWSICAFVVASIGQEFWRGTRVRQLNTKLDFFTSLVGLVGRSKRRYGGYLIHIAIVMLFFGWAGNAYKNEAEATLSPGQSVGISNFTIRFDGLSRTEDLQKTMVNARVTVLDRGQVVRSMPRMPGRDLYKKGNEDNNITMPAIRRFLVGDLYLTLAGYDSERGVANIKAVWNPLVSWYWLGFMMLAFGTAICLAPDRAFLFAAARGPVAATATAGAVLLVILGGAAAARAQTPAPFAGGGVVRPGEEPAVAPGAGAGPGAQKHVITGGLAQKPPKTPLEKELFSQIVCTCPCGRQVIGECECGIADAMRERVRGMLAAGKGKEEVLAAFVAEHGQQILAMPRSKLAWALPYGFGVGALGMIVLLARRWTRRERGGDGPGPEPRPEPKSDPEPPRAAPAAPSDYDERLDDELRDLD